MSCGCKSESTKTVEPTVRDKKENKWNINGNAIAKWAMFLVLTVFSPLMLPFIVIALYFAIIKNQKLNVMSTLRVLTRAAVDMHNEEQDAADQIDLDSAEVLEQVVEDVVENNG